MDLNLTEQQERLRSEVRRFSEEFIRPTADHRSRTSMWDHELYRRMGEYRWPGVVVPVEYGGLGAGALEHAIIVEEVSRVDASLGAALNLVQQTIVAIVAYGTAEQKARYLPVLASGESFAITGITEAEAGSKLSDIRTTAVRDGDEWILNGRKTEVHVPERARVCLVFAKTTGGLTAFLVDTGVAGFEVVRERETVGLRGLPMAEIAFRECRIPCDSVLGAEGGAYDVFFKSFDLTRIGNAAKCIGIAEGALKEAIEYAKRRRIGENVVTDFQGIRWQVADLFTRLEAARLLMYRAAHEYDSSGRCTTVSAMAKLLACTTAMEASTFALQMTGSYGCFAEQPFARYMLDAKVSQITGGTVEVLRNTIARDLLGMPTHPTL